MAKISDPEAVLRFWFEETPPERHFAVDAAFDAALRERFEDLWRAGLAGELAAWEDNEVGAHALIIVLDQFPRNMFRGKAEAFSSDEKAREVARRAVERDFDMRTQADRRAFFYMPFMHSENMEDQDRCVELVRERLGPDSGTMRYALGHRDSIVRFGRFPGRNTALGRENTEEEVAYLNKST